MLLTLYIGRKISVLKSNNRFVSLSSRLATVGILLAVATLITVFSVLSGFKSEIEQTINRYGDSVYLFPTGYYDHDDLSDFLALPYVKNADHFVQSYGLVEEYGGYYPLLISAYGSQYFDNDDSGVVIDEGMNYAHHTGDSLHIVMPTMSRFPKQLKFHVEGTYQGLSHMPKGLRQARVSMQKMKAITSGDPIRGIALSLEGIDAAHLLREHVDQTFPGLYTISDWTQRYKPFIDAIGMQQKALMLILSMIVIVALFSLSSGLMMLSSDKAKEIAVLRMMGLSTKQLVGVFMIQGLQVGLIGCILGYLLGHLISINVASIITALESVMGTTLLHTKVYGVQHLPVEISHSSNLLICLLTLLASMIVSVLPALRLAKQNPSEVLRYG